MSTSSESSSPSQVELSTTPSTSSLSSSTPTTPTTTATTPRTPGILSRQPSTMSIGNVKFAPLPELAPRRRRSNTPLGIASRGQMMRKRRVVMESYNSPQEEGSGSGTWTDDELEEHRRRQAGKTYDDEYMEDPFVVLGKMVKGAWRKMQKKGKNGEGRPALVTGSIVTTEPEDEDEDVTGLLPKPQRERRPSGLGGVWEEEAVDIRASMIILEERDSTSSTSSDPPPPVPPKITSTSSSPSQDEKSAGS